MKSKTNSTGFADPVGFIRPAGFKGRVGSIGAAGFTLVETLIAMALVSAILLPASFWLYRSRTSQAAWERFQALQVLEMRMNRAVLEHVDKDYTEEIQQPTYLRVYIHAVKDGAENRLLGSARDRQDKVVMTLEASFFRGKLP